MKKTIIKTEKRLPEEFRLEVVKFLKDPKKSVMFNNNVAGYNLSIEQIEVKYSPVARLKAYLIGV